MSFGSGRFVRHEAEEEVSKVDYRPTNAYLEVAEAVEVEVAVVHCQLSFHRCFRRRD